MSRWTIEKSGTGIEKSGTGIEKSGTGIEKSGTGIEKSGTGIEKSGTGIRSGLLTVAIAAIAFTSQVSAKDISPEGYLQVAADKGMVSVLWMMDGNTFIGKASQEGDFAQLSLIEMSISKDFDSTDIAGGGTGMADSGVQIAGGGTGMADSGVQIAGGGTGMAYSGVQIAGGGTGMADSGVQIAGGGTGMADSGVQIAGGGTGMADSGVQIAGGGTGMKIVTMTPPSSVGLHIELILGCNSAQVFVLDSNNIEVAAFENVQVMGNTGLCADDGGSASW